MSAAPTRSLPRLTGGVEPCLEHALPEGICRTFRVMPYGLHQGRVLVAATDADDTITEHVVTERLDRPVTLVRHTAAEIIEAVDEAYPPVEAEVESPQARRARMQMTQMLTRSGLVTAAELQRAMLEYARTGDPLGDILVSHGSLSEDVLVAALSEMHQLQRVGLAGFEPDYEIARRLPERVARTLQALPVAEHEGEVLIAVARPLSPEDARTVDEALEQPWRQLLANRSDLDQLVQRIHSHHYTEVATGFLARTAPASSAHVVATPAQRSVLLALVVAAVVCAVFRPAGTATAVVAVASVLYLLVSVHRIRLSLQALGSRLETDVSVAEVAALDERTLPVYTILVPLYREADIVPRLLRDLDALDYPRSRLDIKLLCEADDLETIDQVVALALPPHIHLVVVPDSQPKTKPKACNYGLQLATGTFCVIYDAEDRPDPDQLKKALIAFDRATDDVVCIQAKLNYYNQDQNLLTSWFANEYSMQFDLVLPALGASGSPIPLGGSSNHFKTAVLRELGGWDPFNVTEDADLGIRLHREGYRTAMVDSTTLEEANSHVGNWVRQRSRWSKGHLQTWLVHMRHPAQLLRQVGPRGFVSFNLTMATTLVLLMNPLFWTLTTAYLLTRWSVIQDAFPTPVLCIASVMLVVGNFTFVYLNVAGSLQRGDFGLTRIALLSPIYWGLMSYAAWRGLLQLFTNPFYWEKTEHGLDEPEVRPALDGRGSHESAPVHQTYEAHETLGAYASRVSA
ncbi:glycosyltransferase [Nocardioides rubriscoriae]|uniref:glycosyltransferase n=1 Tax=Nocardioides rubriscoriae TaxID=642762 RepID=UPI0011DF8579|nr:glycosyltransferase [Nocardioides rubriscoriae]